MSNNIIQKETKAPAQAQRETEYWLNPNVDIYEDKDAYTIHAEMPVVNKAGLAVTVEENELVIVGRRDNAAAPGEALHRETRPANFRRAFELDAAIDTGKISARMDQGVLTLTLPKAEQTKPRRINVDGQ